MRPDKFKIINFIKELIIRVDNCLDNFPKKDIELKNRIRNSSYDLLEIAYKANTSNNLEYKTMLIEEIIAKVKFIDFLLNLCYDKKIINSKRYVKFGEKLDDIVKYSTGWIKNLKQ
ncbi:MAG: four helix bundle protein [Clostridia bacterium]|nr:four helix bundle protein [Clostridia bacterium]